MRRLLCTYTTGDEVLVCRAYFLSDLHRRESWDGISPLEVQLGRVVRNAVEYARRFVDSTGRVRKVELTGLPVPDQERYYYFTVEVELANGVDAQEVILDTDGNVIEPEVRTFADSEEYYRYLDSIQMRA